MKIRIWSERSDATQCWLWHYETIHVDWTAPVGTALDWHGALVAAELQTYAQHHARPALPAVVALP